MKDFLQPVTRSLNTVSRSADITAQTEDPSTSTSNPPNASNSSKGKKRKHGSILPSSFTSVAIKGQNMRHGIRTSFVYPNVL